MRGQKWNSSWFTPNPGSSFWLTRWLWQLVDLETLVTDLRNLIHWWLETKHRVSIVKDKWPKQNEFASKFAKRKPSPRTFAIFCEAQRPVQCLSVRRALESGGGLRHNFLRLKYHHHHSFCFRITINSSQIYMGFTKRMTWKAQMQRKNGWG